MAGMIGTTAKFNSMEEVDEFVTKLQESVPVKYIRKTRLLKGNILELVYYIQHCMNKL